MRRALNSRLSATTVAFQSLYTSSLAIVEHLSVTHGVSLGLGSILFYITPLRDRHGSRRKDTLGIQAHDRG